MDAQMTSAAIAIVGTLLGTVIGTWLSHTFSSSREAETRSADTKRIACAIASEIEAILKIEKRRRWRAITIEYIAELRGTNPEEALEWIRKDNRDRASNFTVLTEIYDLHKGSIGALGDISSSVVEFYLGLAATDAGLADIQSELFVGHYSPLDLADLLEEELLQLNELVTMGASLSTKLRSLGTQS